MEQQPISNNFRILLLILTIPQSIAVGIAFQLVFLFDRAGKVYSDRLGDMPLPDLTRFPLAVFYHLEPLLEFRNQVSMFLGVTFLALAIIRIWWKKETFSKSIINWIVPTVAIWCGLFLWASVLAVGLIIPFFYSPRILMTPVNPRPSMASPPVPLDMEQVIASIVLLLWIILLAISVWLFLRKKTRSPN